MNVHVPKDREALIQALDEAAEQLDRPKSQIVLDALEDYLQELHERRAAVRDVELPVFDLGPMGPLRRTDIYDERA